MNSLCRGRARSHAATVPPSSGTIARSSAPQKVHTVDLASCITTFREQTYIRWCCIDLLRPPHLSELREQCGTRMASWRARPLRRRYVTLLEQSGSTNIFDARLRGKIIDTWSKSTLRMRAVRENQRKGWKCSQWWV